VVSSGCELVRENPMGQTKPTQGEPVGCSTEPRARRVKGVTSRCSDYPSTLHEVAAEQAKGGKQREGCCELVRENPMGQTKQANSRRAGWVFYRMEPRARRGKGVAPRCSNYPSTLHEVAAEQAKGGKQREGCCELVRENPIGQTKPTQGELYV